MATLVFYQQGAKSAFYDRIYQYIIYLQDVVLVT